MPVVAVFGSSRVGSDHPEYRAAAWLGRRLGELGLTVANGGYAGTMEAVSAGAASVGARVIGVTAPLLFPGRTAPNPHLSDEYQASSIPQRIARLVEMADATVALPGSIGTAAELMVAWNHNYVLAGTGAPPRLQLVVGEAWGELVGLMGARAEADTSLVTVVESVEEAAEALQSFFSTGRENIS